MTLDNRLILFWKGRRLCTEGFFLKDSVDEDVLQLSIKLLFPLRFSKFFVIHFDLDREIRSWKIYFSRKYYYYINMNGFLLSRTPNKLVIREKGNFETILSTIDPVKFTRLLWFLFYFICLHFVTFFEIRSWWQEKKNVVGHLSGERKCRRRDKMKVNPISN